MKSEPRTRDGWTLAAFLGTVVVMGMNAVAIRFSNRELDPLWGATLRFAAAAAIFAVVLAAVRPPLPRGAALRATAWWGLLGFGGAYGFTYWGLVHVGAGLGQIVLAIVPLATLLLATGVGLERFRWRGLVGGVVAALGITVAFSGEVRVGVPLSSLLAVVLGALSLAASSVIMKRAPRVHPASANFVGMVVGAVALLAASALAGEAWRFPALAATRWAVIYLVATSATGFMLFLYVLNRWSASATSYILVIMPLVTVTGAALLAGEPVTARVALGGAIVAAGVWLGALWRGKQAPLPAAEGPTVAADGRRTRP